MVKKEVPLALQDLLNTSPGDVMVIAFEPLVTVLSDKRRVMACFDGPTMIYDRKQTVFVITGYATTASVGVIT
jgi:hypothetical protein